MAEYCCRNQQMNMLCLPNFVLKQDIDSFNNRDNTRRRTGQLVKYHGHGATKQL